MEVLRAVAQRWEEVYSRGDWGRWPYTGVCPEVNLPKGVDPLLIVDVGDVLRFDLSVALPDPERVPGILLGTPMLIGHLACGGSVLLGCRQNEYDEIITRINSYAGGVDNLVWVKKALWQWADEIRGEIKRIGTVPSGGKDSKDALAVKGDVAGRLAQSIEPAEARLKLPGLNIALDRMLHYLLALDQRIADGGFMVGLVAERQEPVRPGKPLGHFQADRRRRSYLLSCRAVSGSVPRWN